MQIATLSFQADPKESFTFDSRITFTQRNFGNPVIKPSRKHKHLECSASEINSTSSKPLPPVITHRKAASTIYVQGTGIQSSKLTDASTCSFYQASNSRSRLSDVNDIPGNRSRSVTPSGMARSPSRSLRVRFGYPVKIRSSDFYAPRLTDAELRRREDSFVSDSIRSANNTSQAPVIPHYEPFNDPSLRKFFQSSLVLDVVRKTLNVDLNERIPDRKKAYSLDDHDEEYRRIVAKPSSGYGKLNGYDCIPPYAPARHYRSTTTYDKYQSSPNTSLTSFPTYSSLQTHHKRSSRLNQKPNHLKPIGASSPLRNQTEGSSTIVPNSTVAQE